MHDSPDNRVPPRSIRPAVLTCLAVVVVTAIPFALPVAAVACLVALVVSPACRRVYFRTVDDLKSRWLR